jgi:hypothetical protein
MMNDIELREQLAEYAHNAWAGWMTYLFSKNIVNPDGTFTIPAEYVERWYRQMQTAYQELPENEKQSDLKEANEIITIVERYLNG